MLKRNFWKLTLSLAVVLWAVSSLIPLKDRPFTGFAEEKAQAKPAEFAALIKEASARVESKRSTSVFVALKSIAKERKIDLSQYFPQFPLEASLGNIEKRNSILLDYLLAKSKGSLQLGLDLKGGVAFTLEATTPPGSANIGENERKEKLAKAIDIIGERINGLGVAEPIIRAVGDNRIEVQLPGVNTKDNPEIVSSVQKPARLDFRLVYPFGTPATVQETPPGYEIMTLEQEVRGQTISDEIYVKRLPAMTGENVSGSYPVMDEFGRFKINLRFNSKGAKSFADVTREVAEYSQQLQQQSGNPNARARLAIVLDGKLYSAPGVEKEIGGGSAEISGSFTQREAFELANVLNNPLDLPLQVKEQYEVGPSLAQDAIDSGLSASVIGAALVAAFMIMFYTVGGLVAVLSLLVNVVVIFGVMASIGATITLPGLAGIVLTIGMAVDANILIFERMREELNYGKSLKSALHAGYDKAFTTIIDAHLTQLGVCAVMIGLGTGPIKGFGVTLAIGVFSTLFSVLVASHLLLDWLIESEIIKKFPMMKPIKTFHSDYVKWGKPAFIVSWSIVLIGVIVVFSKGSHIYGVDFSGGDVTTVEFKQKLGLDEIRKIAKEENTGEVTPTYVSAIGGTGELLKLETAYDKSAVLLTALVKAHPEAGLNSVGTTSIGPSIGAEIQWNALRAFLFSMVIILAYIAFRFEFGFAIGAVVASVHDILMTIGVFVIAGNQFSAPMVAALLSIVGYSINDTIVVFDRIREELKLNPNTNLRTVINLSINRVFARTLMTSITTLLAAVALWALGTGVMKDLAFTFIVGIVTGTFSSIYIAAPVFYWWHKGDRKEVEAHQDAKPVYEWDAGSKASQ
ncbi:MAG: protein translocase subunit SecD [Opitutaceae bacterium]|jgi:SecD/SecF fusion protein